MDGPRALWRGIRIIRWKKLGRRGNKPHAKKRGTMRNQTINRERRKLENYKDRPESKKDN